MEKADLIRSLKAQMDAVTGGAASEDGAPSLAEPENMQEDFHPKTSCSESSSSAFSKIIDLLNASDKSEASIRERLVRKGFDDQEIDSAVNRAKDLGFIDDMRYADVLIRSRIAQGKGSSGIERELKSNNIDPWTVPGWPDNYEIDDAIELERALSLLRRKPPHSKNPRESAFRKLVNKGYPTSVASSAARLWFEGSRCFYGDEKLA